MNNTTVYVLRKVPSQGDQIEQFEFEEKHSLLGNRDAMGDFIPSPKDGQKLCPPSFSEIWHPRKVTGYVQTGNDYPTIGNAIPTFSQRAVDGLRDLLLPNGELLPLITPQELGAYWAYNVRTVADALDEARSNLVRYSGSFVARKILHHEFNGQKLSGLSIFRIPFSMLNVYVTDSFVERVHTLGLNNFHCLKVWPLPPNTDWELLGRDTWRTQQVPIRMETPTALPPHEFDVRSLSNAEIGEVKAGTKSFHEKCEKLKVSYPSKESLELIEQLLKNIRSSGSASKKEKLDVAFETGVAWGAMVVTELGWEWGILSSRTKEETLAVMPPDRSLAIPVLVYFKRLATEPHSELNAILMYNMLAAGKFLAPPGSLRIVG